MMTKDEFKKRYVSRIVKVCKRTGTYDGSDEDMIYCANESAKASWFEWIDPKEGLQNMSPEDMADIEMDCWER